MSGIVKRIKTILFFSLFLILLLFGFSLFLPFFCFCLSFLCSSCISGVFGFLLSLLGFLKLASDMAEFAHCCQPVLCTEAQYGCLCLTLNSTHGQELMKSVGRL